MISVWLGDQSGWTGVRLAELDRSSFVDRSASSWIGALVRGSELWFVDRSSFSLVHGSEWIGALCVDRSFLVHGSEWIGALVSRSELVLSFSLCCCVWIGARCVAVCAFVLCFSSLFLSVLLCVESDPKMN